MRLFQDSDFNELAPSSAALTTIWLEAQAALVVAKTRPAFDSASVAAIRAILRSIAEGRLGALKFLVFDFLGADGAAAKAPDGFADMIAANAELIVDTPVISLAWARGAMSGLDFDFAMNCSAIVAESGARFSFAGDPFDLLGLYAALGRRIGFAKAERLIESDRPILPQEARDLMIVKDVVAQSQGVEGIADYLAQFERRYNATHAIFRARRIAEPPIDRRPVNAIEGR